MADQTGYGRPNKTIGIMLIISKSPIKEKTEKVFAAAPIVIPLLFKDIKIGSEVFDDERSVPSSLFQDQLTVFSLDKTTDSSPSDAVNLYAVLTETEQPQLFEELLLKSVSDNKSDLTKALTKAITDALNSAKTEPKTAK